MGWLCRLNRLVGAVIFGAQWLALPLILLLFLQWPMRDVVRAYSREANDLGQIFFALFVAVSVTAATRAGTHLSADAVAQRYSPRLRHYIRKVGALVGLTPWALFVLIASKSTVISSLKLRESFPDTGNSGYFVIKLSLWIMASIILAQAFLDIARPVRRDNA
jgi:TRAP-type mannitol/chloroaromatic compound transport system permease small subunit